jgi:hypothetical protein
VLFEWLVTNDVNAMSTQERSGIFSSALQWTPYICSSKRGVRVSAASCAFSNEEATMKAVVGVFKSRSDGVEGAAALVPMKIPAPESMFLVLTPELTDEEIAPLLLWRVNSPGMGEAMGAVVGGAVGVAGVVGFAPAKDRLCQRMGVYLGYARESRAFS